MEYDGGGVYPTLQNLVDQEISPALGAGEGVGESFDLEGFVKKLLDEGLIRYVAFENAAQWNGFQLVMNEHGDTPRFWHYVQEFDQ